MKYLNLDTDSTLGGDNASDSIVSSQRAIKTYIDNKPGGGGVSKVNNISPDSSGNVTITASDVGALPDSTSIPTTTNNVISGSTAALTSGGAYTNLVTKVEAGSTANIIKVTKAGSDSSITINDVAHATVADSATSATSATTASKLGSTTIGGSTSPIYLSGGTPTPLDYTIAKSVPSDAVFTDTKNTAGSTDTSSQIYLIGATSQTENSTTYSQDSVFVDTSGQINSANPAAATSSTVVATTKWVSDKGFLTSHQTIKQDGITGATINRFGTCSTGATTAAKTVSITTGTYSLGSGSSVRVKFSNANTADNPTLNISSTGAKNIFHKGSRITTGTNKALLAGVCDFVYDGTQYHLVGNYLDTDTTYTNGTGITIGTGNAINHSNSVTAGTVGTSSATSGSTLSVPYVTYDAQGHITATGTHTHTVSGFATTDTKNTAGSTDTSSKIFLVGATSQATNPQTYSHDTVFVDTNGRLNSAAPATTANDTTVATTKWVKDQGYTYSGGTGITIGTGNAINHTNSITAGTAGTSSATSGSTLSVPYVTYDAQGHITASGTHTHTVSGFATTDTQDTCGAANSTSKLYLVGRTAQSTGTSNSNSAVYTQNGYLYATTPSTSSNTTAVATTAWVVAKGYTTNTGTVTKVNNISPDANGNVSLTIPTNISSFNNDSGYVTASVQTLQPITPVTYAASQTITLTANSSIYRLAPTGNITSMTFSLAATEGASDTTAYTFELYLDISSTPRSIAFPALSVLTWQDGESPDLSETGIYLLTFRTMDGGSHWIGNLQGKW